MRVRPLIFILPTVILLLLCTIIFPTPALAGVKIDSPANGASVGGIVPVTISWDSMISSLYCTYRYTSGGSTYVYPIGYSAISPPASSGSRTFGWDTSGIPNGTPVSITVTTSSVYQDTITLAMVNNPPPALIIVSPVNGAKIPSKQTTLLVTISFHNVAPNYHGIRYISNVTSWNTNFGVSLPGNPTSGGYDWGFNIAALPLNQEQWVRLYCEDDSGKATTVILTFTKVIPGPDIPLTKQVPQKDTTTVGEPINVANGNMFTTRADILIPAKEAPLEFACSYNSQDDFNGQFGFGWRSNFDINLEEYPDASVVETDKTGVYTIYSKNTDGTYQPSAGKYSVLTKNADNTYTILRKGGEKLYFNNQGCLTKIEARNGSAINIERMSGGVVSEVTDSSGRELTFTNNSQGRVTQISDSSGRIFKYEYDGDGNLTKTIDPLDHEAIYSYNNHNLTCLQDANGHSLYFEYDSSDRAYHSWQDANNNEVSLSFDPGNSITTVTDSHGSITKYEYNAYGLVTKITDSLNNTQGAVWDSNMNKVSVTDQNLHAAYYAYDLRGNLLSSTDPLGNTTTFTYESTFDFIKTVTDAQGNVTVYDYDAKGNLIKLTDALGYFTVNIYDDFGQLTSLTNPRNYTTTFTYDQYGNLLTTTDALGDVTTFSYDILGNRAQVKDAKNNITQFSYNGLNQLIQITYPDDSILIYTYDALGNKLSVTDNAGNTTIYTYDLNNKVTSITNPLGKVVTFEYDTEGNRTKVIDQSLHEITYQYDSLNRLISEINPLGLVKTYTYDAAGNRISATDAKGNIITYEYDSLNRLKKINYSDTSAVSFAYDSLGRRISMIDTQGTTNYSYDSLGRLTRADGPKDNDTLQYSYDEVGNRISLTLPDGGAIYYGYDALNRLASITAPDNKTTTYAYDEVGNPVEVTYPNNIQASYSFDALHRLTRLTNQNQINQDKLSEFIYIYDSAGRRSRIQSLDGITDYSYDALGELIGETRISTVDSYQITYEYDPSGNRARMLKNNTEHVYDYDNANELTQENLTGSAQIAIDVTGTVSDANGIQSIAVNGINAALNGNGFTAQINLSPGPNTITVSATDAAGNTATKTVNVTYGQTEQIIYFYDNNGNLIKKQSPDKTLNLGYDYENRLKAISQELSPQGTVPEIYYAYDGAGRRISSGNGSDVTNYLYDGMDVVLELDALGDPVTSYLRNPNSAGGIGGIIQGLSPQGTVPEIYYSYDGLGSVANLTDSSGANIQSYAYDAFGNTLATQELSSQGAAPANTHQFLTKETDPSGLIFFGARYYDPTLGRFITLDPTGMSDGPNMYVYVINDPINLVDLWGLCKARRWAPRWMEIIITGYGYYGGPFRTDPTFQIQPEDSMDELFMQHDRYWAKGQYYLADRKLLTDLGNLPINPFNWKRKPRNILGAVFYSNLATAYFFWIGS